MKIGDRVEAIWASEYGYIDGWQGVIQDICDNGAIDVLFDNKKKINGCDDRNFKVIKEEPMNTFKKSDLKTGMMVQLADKHWYLVLTNTEPLEFYKKSSLSFWDFKEEFSFMSSESYTDTLDEITRDKDWDVIKVASCNNFNWTILNAFINHSDPTAIPGFHIIWSRESDEKAKVISVIEGLQKDLDDAKRKLEELG